MNARLERAAPGIDLARVRWRCRRGLKELDLLLERYVRLGLPELSHVEVRAFDALLDHADPDLLDWICGRSAPAQERLRRAVESIRGSLDLDDRA